MKVESRVFEICAGFFFLCGIVYTFLAAESVGVAGLFLTGGLALIIGSYFRFVSRRLDERPEDDPEAEVADGAGEIGFFSPGSYWPFGMALGAAALSVALAFMHLWLVGLAIGFLLLMIAGLVFEYHVRPSHH